MRRAVSVGKGHLLPLLLGLAAIETASADGRGSPRAAPAADLPAGASANAQPAARARDPRPPDGPVLRQLGQQFGQRLGDTHDDQPETPWLAGAHYEKLSPPVIDLSASRPAGATGAIDVMGAPGTKVVVAEFFWYACRHCLELESLLAEWARTRAAQVEFVRIPVTWHSRQVAHARLFYTLRALGRDDLDGHVFDAIHAGTNALAAPTEAQTLRLQLAFAEANGISVADFATAWRSARVEQDLENARRLAKACRVDAVPAMVINGEYLSTPRRAGGKSELMRLVADLVSLEHARVRAP